jgi:uncharacterized protein YndB with AHSA1/START domain
MTVKNVIKDPENLTLSLVGEFAAPRQRVWRVWEDSKLLGAWWGPPGWPSTVLLYELRVDGTAHYNMQGPEGERHYGGWKFTSLEAPRSLSFDDFFADEACNPNPVLPGTKISVALDERVGVSTMTLPSRFATLEQLEQLTAMGMVEGMTAAMGQIDALLADG